MSTIRKITTLPPAEGVNVELIDHLTGLLDRARKGEITELLYTYWQPAEKDWDFGWTGGSSVYEALGAMDLMRDYYKQTEMD